MAYALKVRDHFFSCLQHNLTYIYTKETKKSMIKKEKKT